MKSTSIKLGFVAVSVAAIFVFQNCSKSEFTPISSTQGDITDPVIANSAKCEYDGQSYYHSEKIKTYKASSVAFDKACEQQEHICNNGTWSGTIGFKSCAVGVARDCLVGTDTIKHNEETLRFEVASVAYNQSCKSEARKCFDGQIPGSYTVKNCVRRPPPAPLNQFFCQKREGQSDQKVQDLYQKFTEGPPQKVATCSNWHSSRVNASWNCGKLSNGIYGSGAPIADQPSCCPQGYTVTNGVCRPIAQRGQACFGTLDCADGLVCDTDRTSDSTPFDRTCQ